MPLQIVRNDITKMSCDAIVNAANRTLLGGGGVDGAIHWAAGPKLLAKCATLGGCRVGEAKLTPGYKLPARYIIHTVGPIWHGGKHGEEESLRSCYYNSLALALEKGFESVAFPLISAGAYGYPKEEALGIAVTEITHFLLQHDMTVYLVVYDKNSFQISKKLIDDIAEYIDQRYVDIHTVDRSAPLSSRATTEGWAENTGKLPQPPPPSGQYNIIAAKPSPRTAPGHLCSDEALALSLFETDLVLDESFSQMLLRKINEAGITDSECYKRANIDRKLFSKIRKDVHYKPSKPTAMAFAISLKLNLEETRELLEKAGFALSHSFKFDLIVEYFIQKGNYDIFEINEVLFAFDQSLLGG